MIVKPKYYSQHRFKKKVVRSSLLLYLLMYIFTGLQANIHVTILGYSNVINLLLILTIFLIIEFDWNEVSWYCIIIGLILDAFTVSQFGLSAIALWGIGFILSRIKQTFYIEYISTGLFLLFILILSYCFVFYMWNYGTNQVTAFIGGYTEMVMSNAPLDISCYADSIPIIESLIVW